MLLPPPLQESTPHVTDTYVNGYSGYRIWSDGYCEQWGRNGNGSVTLLKTYNDVKYNLLAIDGGNTSSYIEVSVGITSVNTINIKQSQNHQCFWRTCGYLALGQY